MLKTENLERDADFGFPRNTSWNHSIFLENWLFWFFCFFHHINAPKGLSTVNYHSQNFNKYWRTRQDFQDIGFQRAHFEEQSLSWKNGFPIFCAFCNIERKIWVQLSRILKKYMYFFEPLTPFPRYSMILTIFCAVSQGLVFSSIDPTGIQKNRTPTITHCKR